MTLVAEIGDIGRFATARKLCAGGGLPPSVPNSDRKVRHGHITKQGSPWVRWVLEEAAQRAKTRPPFAGFDAQCAARRASRSPPWRLPASCWLARFSSSRRSPPSGPLEKVSPPGALAPSHAPESRPKH
jgi:hypothetical protein